MSSGTGGTRPVVTTVDPREPDVAALLEALTRELAAGEYGAEGTFGYSVEQLVASGVHVVGVRVAGALVGVGGVELQADRTAELKRFYVAPAARGTGAADAVMAALVEHARAHGVTVLRLETGDRQHAAMRFYARHGFTRVARFGPYVDSTTSVCLARDLLP